MTTENRIAEKEILENDRPFLGLRSYEEKNKSQFGGRDREIKELYKLIDNFGLTVVFGKSGIGKTSLIKAGLMPELRRNFYFPIYARIDYSSKTPALQQLKERAFRQMRKKDPSIPEFGGRTLWEYFHDVNFMDDLVTPVLLLDQFEETFTLGEANIQNVRELIIELADLAENQIPLSVQKDYKERNDTIPSYYGKQPYRVVLSLREDYLARLEEGKAYIPSIMDNRFRVVQMTIKQALKAAVKPGKGLLDETVAKEIIKKLPGVSQSDFDILEQNKGERQRLKVEPFLLSLICDRINEKRIKKGIPTITVDLVSEFNVNDVISSFYNETIIPYGDNVERAVEERLLTDGGFRKLQALEEFQNLYDIQDQVISELVAARILRKELRDGVEYVELIHDVLAPVIKEKRDKRVKNELEAERQKEVEAKREAAIAAAKDKNRARLIKVGMIAAAVLIAAMTVAYTSHNQKLEIEQRNDKMALARTLLFTAQSTSSYDAKNEKAAILSRSAYLIYNEFKSEQAGENMYRDNFYNSMLVSLQDLGMQFLVTDFHLKKDNKDSRKRGGVKAAVYNDTYQRAFFALNDYTVQRMRTDQTAETAQKKDTLYDFNANRTRVTSMDTYEKNGIALLAMAGTMDSIILYDIEADSTYRKISVPNNPGKKGKSLQFTGDGRLILFQGKTLVGWDNTYEEAIIWSPREERIWNDSTQRTTTRNRSVPWGQTALQIPGSDKSISCFSISKDDSTIAIAIENGIILVTDNTYTELQFSKKKIGIITVMKFDPAGNKLIMGNRKGAVFSMSLDNAHTIDTYQSHTNKITDIAFNTEGSLLATSSSDGTVVLWNDYKEENWSALPLSTLVYNRNMGPVNDISFKEKGQYIYASYDSGDILKWPTSMEILDHMICERVTEKLTSDELLQYEQELIEILAAENLDVNAKEYTCGTDR